jgi:hypothetical protein
VEAPIIQVPLYAFQYKGSSLRPSHSEYPFLRTDSPVLHSSHPLYMEPSSFLILQFSVLFDCVPSTVNQLLDSSHERRRLMLLEGKVDNLLCITYTAPSLLQFVEQLFFSFACHTKNIRNLDRIVQFFEKNFQ